MPPEGHSFLLVLAFVQRFLHDPTYLVFAGSSLATFVALVLAQEQQAKVRNGIFGTAAGSAMGGVAGLYKGNPTLLVVGFVGSALGGALGWLYHLIVAAASETKLGRAILEYQAGGIESVRQRLIREEQALLLAALREWRQSFVRAVEEQKDIVLSLHPAANLRRGATLAINNWFVWFVESYGMIFDIADKPKYRSRVTVILFGKTPNGEISGKHWISYSGKLDAHKSKGFPKGSIGYRVLSEELPSPYFTDSKRASESGISREEVGVRPFITFRVSSEAVISLDWPEELDETDPYVQLARDTFHTAICPAIAALVAAWSGDIEKEIGLRRLDGRASPRR